jgi:hypothetical protein
MGNIIITPAKCMKVNGRMINLMGRENTLISMVTYMKVNGGIFDY